MILDEASPVYTYFIFGFILGAIALSVDVDTVIGEYDVNTVPKSINPFVGVFVFPLIVILVTVPKFLVNPQLLTVDSRTSAGIVGLLRI